MITTAQKSAAEREAMREKAAREERMQDAFDAFEGDTKGLDTLVPNDTILKADWNNNHLFPVTKEDKVFIHPNQDGVGDKYVRVVYHPKKFVAVLSKNNFK